MRGLQGIIPALVTPNRADNRPDLDAMAPVVDHVLDGGVHGIFVLGGQGEFWAYSNEEHQMIATAAVAAAGGRVPVLVGISAETTRQSRDLSERAAAAGGNYVTMMPPMVGKLSEGELERHVLELADSSELPLVLYNHPSRSRTSFTVPLVARLSQHPSIVAIKDSSGSMEYLMAVLAAVEDGFDVLVGHDAMIAPALLGGCSGAIASTGNVIPRLLVDLFEACLRGDIHEARRLQSSVLPLREAFTLGTFPVVVKEAMALIGLPVGGAAPPIAALSESSRAELQLVITEVTS